MNFYTLAAREERFRVKMVDKYRLAGYDDETAKTMTNMELDRTFDQTYRRAVTRMLMAQQINEEMGLTEHKARFFMITVRPDPKLNIKFDDFYDLVYKYVNRACFVSYTLSFEQKGLTDETLGEGFHVHIIADMTQKGKAMVLRDTQSTFKRCTADNCVKVDWCRNPVETVNNYLIEYNSKDNHKKETKTWDYEWRKRVHLNNIYENNLPKERAYQVRVGTQIVELN